MRYKGILFDMDGTVLDTLSDLHAAVNHSLTQFGYPPVSRQTVRAGLGNGAAHLLHACMPGQPEERVQQLLAYYQPWYEQHCRIDTRPYPGILSLMERLRAQGARLAIISNKGDAAVRALAGAFFPGLLETAVGESETVRRKPNPDALLAAAAQMGLELSDCVYVGDSEVDLRTAENAGLACISVAWGFRDEEELRAAGARHIVHSAEELEALL